MRTGILGGGLTGLSLARFLRGEREILEKENICGGLCRSHSVGGFSFDNGGHILFSRDSRLLKRILGFLGGNVRRYRRNNRIYFEGRYVKYPFENDLAALPKEVTFDCLYHYLTDSYPPPTNFREWIYQTFGRGIAEHYMIPYNEKIWKTPVAEMSIEWAEGRIPKPPVEDVIRSALGIPTEGYTHQLYFYYPARGGIQALTESLERGFDGITRGYEVRGIARGRGEWVVTNGREERRYDRLVSTIPLFHLIDAIEGADDEVRECVSRLRYTSLAVVFLGLRGRGPEDKFAVYFPDPSLVYHRVCFYGFLGDAAVPPGKASAVAEITYREGDEISGMSDRELVKKVEEGLVRDGIIESSRVERAVVHREKYAYVVYDRDYARNLGVVKKFVSDSGIELCGRFAEFEYLNMDACVRHALELSQRLNGEEGLTCRRPHGSERTER